MKSDRKPLRNKYFLVEVHSSRASLGWDYCSWPEIWDLAGTVVLWFVGIIVKFDFIGKVIVQLHFSFLGQSISCDSRECLFNLDCLFSTSFKVRDVVLRLTPWLGSPGRHLAMWKKQTKIIPILFLTRVTFFKGRT